MMAQKENMALRNKATRICYFPTDNFKGLGKGGGDRLAELRKKKIEFVVVQYSNNDI